MKPPFLLKEKPLKCNRWRGECRDRTPPWHNSATDYSRRIAPFAALWWTAKTGVVTCTSCIARLRRPDVVEGSGEVCADNFLGYTRWIVALSAIGRQWPRSPSDDRGPSRMFHAGASPGWYAARQTWGEDGHHLLFRECGDVRREDRTDRTIPHDAPGPRFKKHLAMSPAGLEVRMDLCGRRSVMSSLPRQ